ncbi:hypothetical protein ACSNOI_08355 [Actinomadura kijaniata]|uniref:hypothetical protein n=1 Tax=Actinomadura kijaniata TaxID=46161 RepID=UPI003F1E3470
MSQALVEELLGSGDAEVARHLGFNKALPASVLGRLAAHPDPRVRATVPRRGAGDPVAPDTEVLAGLLERLADDPEPMVREAVAAHSDAPAAVRNRLMRDPVTAVREALARGWTDAPPEAHRVLLTDAQPTVRAAALSPWHPRPPRDLHEPLLAHPSTRAGVLPSVELTPQRAEALAASGDGNVRAALAAHPDLPEAVRTALADDPQITVRVEVLLSRWIPPETRARLHAELTGPGQDEADRWISSYLLGNAWKDRSRQGWLLDAPLERRLAHLDSPYAFERRAAAAGGGLPAEVVMRLMKDPDVQVRRIAAGNSAHVPGEELERLVREHGEDTSVMPLLVEHPRFPPQGFVRLARSGDPRLRLWALEGEDLPAALVSALAADPVPSVRRRAAGHRNLPVSCLPSLLADDDPQVVEAAGAAPGFPVPWMRRLTARPG